MSSSEFKVIRAEMTPGKEYWCFRGPEPPKQWQKAGRTTACWAPPACQAFPRPHYSILNFMKEARTRKGTQRAPVTRWVGAARHGPGLWTPSSAPSPSTLTLSTSAGVGVKGLLLPTHVPMTSWPGRHHHGPRGQPQNTSQQLTNSTFA